MNRLIVATIAIMAFGNVCPANAQRDAGDRGLRLENDQLRNDTEDRLKKRQDTVLPQATQSPPAPDPARKTKRSKQQN